MLIDGVRFEDASPKNARSRAIASFIGFIERKLGLLAVIDKRRSAFERPDLAEVLRIAHALEEAGVVEWFGNDTTFPDEPHVRLWWCRIRDENGHSTAGSTLDDDKQALTAALAEGLERYIWLTQQDFYECPIAGTARDIAARFPAIIPERFAGFSDEQRAQDPALTLAPDASYLWIRGHSLVTGKKTYVPAQQVSAVHRSNVAARREPLIRKLITNGLATWPTRTGAQLAGALECIEREAYMIMWFNQLTLPRAKLAPLRARSVSLDELIRRCERYRLKVHIIPMLTDAPTYAVCAIVEDASEVGPRFVLGLKANRSLARAAEGAILEALRARKFTRRDEMEKYYDPDKGVDAIGHRGRVYYWAEPDHAKHLEFLINGEEKEFPEAAWENDTTEEHLQRIIAWCKVKDLECVSFSLGISKKNPTRWHIEMVVMPELQPTHLEENRRHLGGERLKAIPVQFGYPARETPFVARPHPYC